MYTGGRAPKKCYLYRWSMVLPAIAAAAASKAGHQVVQVLDKPIIGWSTVTTRKNKTVKRSFELNGWHCAAIGGVTLAFIGLGMATGVLRWNKQTIKDKNGKTKAEFYLPGANPDAVSGGMDSYLRKAAAGSAPNYILGGGPLGLALSTFWGGP